MKPGNCLRRICVCLVGTAVCLTAVAAPAAAIDSYLTDEAPIARHDKRTSSIKILRSSQGQLGRLFYAGRTEQSRKEDRVISYRELPLCSKPEVSLLEVYRHNPLTEAFDVLYYEPDDGSQAAKAAKYTRRAVAYKPALINDPRTGDTDLWQTFARFTKIDCLPTRFRFIHVGGRRYMEFRKGELAWSESTAPSGGGVAGGVKND